jgi:hypothetical protein
MQTLLDTVESFSEWSGIRVNLRKSEISGYNFRSRRALWVRDLTIGGGKMTYLEPTKAFKYLGIRVSITGDMREERKYIEQATTKMIKSIAGHQYSPAQMHWVVQVAIIPIFRYSAALAGWTEGGLQTLEKAWTRAFRQAWRTGKTTPAVTFWAPREHGGLGCLSARAIVTQEVIGLMRQSAELEDDLKRVGKYELRRIVTDKGCTTLEAACRESQWDGDTWAETTDVYERFISHASRSMSMQWEDMVPEGGEAGKEQQQETVGERGIMTIMRQETPEGRDHERWRSARAWLRRLPGWGIRTVQEVQKERTVILPDMLRRMMKQEEQKELEWAVENEGVQLKIVWTGEEQRNAQTPQTPKLREAARGEELIGGTVRQRGKKGYVAGKITGFDGRDYDVRLYNGLQIV